MYELWQTEWCPASRRVAERLRDLRMNVDLLSKLPERAIKTAPDGRRDDAQVWELRKPKALAPLLVLVDGRLGHSVSFIFTSGV
jgi:hypothetical protein